jgi:cobalt-zinc-cadmium efflux system outer membrane protein
MQAPSPQPLVNNAVVILFTVLLLAVHIEAQTPDRQPGRRITLADVFDSVRTDNPTLSGATARVRAARGALSSARTWSNPVLSFESQKMTDNPMSPAQRETMTTAMLPLEPVYQRGPRVKRAEAIIRASEADRFAQRQQVAMDAAGAFYHMALVQVHANATRSLAEWLDTVVTYNTIRVREGAAAEADLIRSELERDLVRNDLAMTESELAQAESNLQIFLSRQPNSSGVIAAFDSLPLDATRIMAGNPSRASWAASYTGDSTVAVGSASGVRRPEVEAARQRLRASDAAVAGEHRLFIRELGAMIGNKNSGGTSSLMAGFSMPLPLLDQNRGAVETARAEQEGAQFDLALEERRAAADLAGAQRAEAILSERVARGSAGYLGRAEEAKRIALGAYREGGTTLLQVIDAARAWREARNSYFETLFAQHRAVLALLIAQGIDVLDAFHSTSGGGRR